MGAPQAAILVGCLRGRGVLIQVDGVQMIVTPDVARQIAKLMLNAADVNEAEGGPDLAVQEASRMSTQEETVQIASSSGLHLPKPS
jgi:hypothetical protein